jgi:molecular chaperone DnaK
MAVVGIDLGTTNTVVASVRAGRVHVLADEHGHRLLPSVVSFHPNGEVLVGHPARERRAIDARNTVSSVKRFIGRAWDSEELKRARRRFSFELKEGVGQGPLVVARGHEYTLPEVSAFVLRRARQIAERSLGETVDRAVITVPANFNELQRAATKVAARIAGLEVLRIINEPTAAALAYGLGRATKERISVYDFGGGTFDCTLLELSGNVFEVLATAGDTFLGGDDLDAAIAERMADAFLRAHRYEPRDDPQAFERLRLAAEIVKIQLSAHGRAQIKLHEIAFGVGGTPLELDFAMTRDEFDALAGPFVERTLAVCQEALAIARMAVSAFDKIILVGGSTRVALVRHRVEQFFDARPLDRVNPEEVVAIGAAIQATALSEAARRRSIPPPPVPTIRKSTTSLAPAPARGEDDITVSTQLPAQIAAIQRARQALGSAPDVRPATGPASQASAEPAPIARQALGSAPDVRPATGPASQASAEPASIARQALGSAPDVRPATGPASQASAEPASIARHASPRPPFPSSPSSASFNLTPASTSGRQGSASPSSPGRSDLPTALMNPPARTGLSPALANLPPASANLPSSLASPSPVKSILSPTFASPPTPAIAEIALSLDERREATSRSANAPVLIDVTPHALVVETVGGWCDVVVQRNAKIPCERARAFATSSDGQTVVRVRVAQGGDPVFRNNTYLGEVELTDLRAAARGAVTIQVRFEIDESGTLQVFAMDVASGREAHAVLQLVGIAGPQSVASMKVRHAEAVVR